MLEQTTDLIENSFVKKSLKMYVLAFFSLLPGYVIGEWVLVGWYAVVLYLLLSKDFEGLIFFYIIWIFLGRGAYHYKLLGENESVLLIRLMGICFLVAIGVLCFSRKWDMTLYHKKILLIFVLYIGVVVVSAVVNGVSVIDLIYYIVMNFRWMLFAVLLLFVSDKLILVKSMILFFVIIGVNGFIAVLQQFVLPIQATPSGYIPDYYDLASGLLGVTFSQHLTMLSILCATFFLIRYLLFGKLRELVAFGMYMIQPFSSSSRAFLIVGGIFMACAAIMALWVGNRKKTRRGVITKFLIIYLSLMLGVGSYESLNKSEFGGFLDPAKNYFNQISEPDKIMKIAGYITTIELVMPNGRLGEWLGVGPGRFISATDPSVVTDYSGLIYRGNEDADLSSVDKQDTEMVANIGELGWIGFLSYICILFYLIFNACYGYFNEKNIEWIAVWSMFLVICLSVTFLAFYAQGLILAFYYIPLFILTYIVFDRRSHSVNQ